MKRKNNDIVLIVKMFLFFYIIPFYLIFLLIKSIVSYFNKKSIKNKNVSYDCNYSSQKTLNSQYVSKKLVTDCEKYFFEIINDNFGEHYRVIPQVPLSSVVNKIKDFDKQYQGELYRTIDFGIFDKTTFEPLLMIEINDNTHNRVDRINRDAKVKSILKAAKIPLITFYSDCFNKPSYVVEQIKNNLSDIKIN